MFDIFILSLGLAVSSMNTSESEEAIKNLSIGYYQYRDIDGKVKDIEKIIFNKDIRENISTLILINDVVKNQYISYTWRF